MKNANNTLSIIDEEAQRKKQAYKALLKVKEQERVKIKNGYSWVKQDKKTLILKKDK